MTEIDRDPIDDADDGNFKTAANCVSRQTLVLLDRVKSGGVLVGVR